MKIKIALLFILFSHNLDAQWLSLKTMPTPRQEMPATLVNRKIYMIGGITTNLLEGLVTRKNEAYDISTNTWKILKDMPAPRHHPAVAAVQNKIYVIGGYDNVAFNPVNTVFVYDISTDSWTSALNLPLKAGAGDAVTYQNKIYYFGGSNDSLTLDVAYVFDPVQNTWTSLQPMPTAREHIAATLIDSLIYITAGRGSADAEKLLQIYDPQSNSWTSGADIRTPRSGSDAVTHDHKMYVLGGEGSRAFYEFEEYDPRSDTWDSFPRMLHARHGLGCVVLNDTLYAVGGATQPGFAPCSYNEAFVFNSVPTSLTVQRSHSASAYWISRNILLVDIGEKSSQGILSIYKYDGALVYTHEIWTHQPLPVDTRSWSEGPYILSFKTAGSEYSMKLLPYK